MAVGDGDAGGGETYRGHGDGPLAAGALGTRQRAFHNLGAAAAPFAGGDQLIGIRCEQGFEGVGILMVARVHVLLHDGLDGGFIGRWILRQQWSTKKEDTGEEYSHA